MPQEHKFTCTACLEPQTGPHLLIATSPLCHTCFRTLFTLALQSESSYPANWAGHPLSPARYAHILGPSLLSAYEEKALEYCIPLSERVFCAHTDPPRRPEECGCFVGRWGERKKCVRCEKCLWYTCLRCEGSFSTSFAGGEEVDLAHECDPRRDQELEERAFEGLVRGVDWQICPNEKCKRRVQLKEGCNHVVCVCRAHFCFICGAFVRDGEGHWSLAKGGCPRFGKRGDKRAIYDERDLWDDNGDVGDEEQARRIQDQEDADEGGGVEALRRAFEMQMRMVDEVRRDLMRRGAGRGDSVGEREGGGRGEGRRRRIRRRRPGEGNRQVDGHQEEPLAQDRREDMTPQQAAPESLAEPGQRKRRGIRAFLHDAIDATEYVLFGGQPPRRDEHARRGS